MDALDSRTSNDVFSNPLRALGGATSERLDRQAWAVGALCLAISDTLQARFNPVVVRGEISGFSAAASGHCYFTLKDAQGQLRAAMFKRAASALNFVPKDGQQVEVRARLGVYEQRGDLQLVVDSMSRLGQGTLLEEFMRLKAKLEAMGLFSLDRKRPLRWPPRGIGVVTSPNAAAWHDVMTALQRRVPHIPVLLSPARVQGAEAPQELVTAMHRLYAPTTQAVDVILLVRGGGSLEDLWAFNDEQLAHTIAQSPVPVICGVGHETDFSIADFVADVRAPTPTAAAELCAPAWSLQCAECDSRELRLQSAAQRWLEREAQGLDLAARRLLQPSEQLYELQQQLRHTGDRMVQALRNQVMEKTHQIAHWETRLELLHPQQVLNRGFAWVSDEVGAVVKNADQLQHGQSLQIHLAKGSAQVKVFEKR